MADLTLTGLTELLYNAKDIVCNEPTAFVDSAMINSGSEGISINGTVNSFRTQAPTVNTDYTPAMTLPVGDALTVTTDTLVIGQKARVNIPLNGELLKQLDNTAGRENVINNLLAQSIRALRNTIELHVGTVAAKASSRATGTAGTTPFATVHNSVNAVRQILFDNGCPVQDGGVTLVVGTTAGTNIRNLTNLYKVNEAGTDTLLRRGILQDISNIGIKESSGVASITGGAMASATTNAAGYAIGATVITLAAAGTGVIAAGDFVSFAGESNVYGVQSVNFAGANPAAGDTITLAQPGLRKAMSAAPKAITVTASYTANICFHRSAIELVMRPPQLPPGGDIGEHSVIADTKTGLVFDAGLYRGDGMAVLRLLTYYQAKVWKPEFVATLLG